MFKVYENYYKDESQLLQYTWLSILHLVWVFLWPFYKKKVKVQYGIGSTSMLIASHIHNAANHVIAKNNCQSYFKKFEVLFSRKQQGAIRADWKIYPCISYHFSIDVFDNDFSSGNLIFDIFNNTTFFGTMQKTGECNYVFTYANWNINLTIGFGNHA